MIFVLFARDDYFRGVEFAVGILFVKSGCDFLFGFGVRYEGNFWNENVSKGGHSWLSWLGDGLI